MFDNLNKALEDRYFSNSPTKIDLGSEALKRFKKSYERLLYMSTKYPLKDRNGFIPSTYAINISFLTQLDY
jgi:hypothetical protein